MLSNAMSGTTKASWGGVRKFLCLIVAVVMAVGLMPLPSYAIADNGNSDNAASSPATTLSTQEVSTQAAEGYIYIPSSNNLQAANSNASTYPGCSPYGSNSFYNNFLETLYLKSEIGGSPHSINSLAYYLTTNYETTKALAEANVKIYLAETSSSAISSASDLVSVDSATLVYEGATTLGGTAKADWQEFTFNKNDGKFDYSGTQNLAVIFMFSATSYPGALLLGANQSNAKGWWACDDENAASFADYTSIRNAVVNSTLSTGSKGKSVAQKNRASIRFGYSDENVPTLVAAPSVVNRQTASGNALTLVTASADADKYTLTCTSANAEDVTISNGGATAIKPGTYEFSATLEDTEHYRWPDNTTAPKTFTAVIVADDSNGGTDGTPLSDTFADENSRQGNGSEASPYLLSTEDDLIAFQQAINADEHATYGTEKATYAGKHFKLMADIKLTKVWVPVGKSTTLFFGGTFDGNGHAIKNVRYAATSGTSTVHSAFFGYLRTPVSGENVNVVIKNLKVSGAGTAAIDIDGNQGTSSTTGGIVGYANPNSTGGGKITIENCVSDINISGARNVGGVVGQANTNVSISNCLALGNVVMKDGTSAYYGSYGGGILGLYSTTTSAPEFANNLFFGQITPTNKYNELTKGFAFTVNALVGKATVSGTSGGTSNFANNHYITQENGDVKAWREGSTDVVDPIDPSEGMVVEMPSSQAEHDALAEAMTWVSGSLLEKNLPGAESVVEPAKKYKVSFVDDDNATVLKDEAEYEEGTKVSSIKPSDPTKEATAEYTYTFKAWDPAISENTEVTADQVYKATYDATKNSYAVTFDSDGGSEVAAQTVEYGSTATAPAESPTKDGYVFKGWKAGESDYDFDTPVTGALTLKAAWEAEVASYTVTFVNAGETVATRTVKEGDTTTAPDNPSRSGYAFTGWYDGGKAFSASEPVTADATYTASWRSTYTRPTTPTPTNPSTDEKSDDKPSAEQPSTEQPSAEQPDAEKPSADQPTTEQPAAEEPEVPSVGEDVPASVGSATVTVDVSDSGTATLTHVDSTGTSMTVNTVTTADGSTVKVSAIAANAFKGNSELKSVTIGANVKTIGASAFASAKNLATVSVGKNVTSIGSKAFSGCAKLKTVSIGKNVTTIGANAFNGCAKLSTVKLGSKVVTVGTNAFKGCSSLKSVTVGKNVKNVRASAFAGSKKLKTLNVSSTKLTKASCKSMLKSSSVQVVKLVGMTKAQKKATAAKYSKWFPKKVNGKKLVIK